MNFCIVCAYPLGQKKSCPRCKEAIRTNSVCLYCEDIYLSTPKSPRRKYKYCPMCGTELEKNKFKKWGQGNARNRI